MKDNNGAFEVSKSYQSNLQRKKNECKSEVASRKNIFVALISPFGLKHNVHSNSIIDNVITLDNLF